MKTQPPIKHLNTKDSGNRSLANCVKAEMAPNVFGYIKYRDFLSDYYHFKKASKKDFSFGSFALKAQLSTRNYLKRVMDGERNLTKNVLVKFCKALDFDEEESIYFEYLVNYEQTKDQLVKKYYFEKLRSLAEKKEGSYFSIHSSQYDVFQEWYFIPLYEYFALENASSDPKKISEHFKKTISPKQVKEALNLLQKLNFIEWNPENAKFKQLADNIKYEQNIVNLAIQKYHKSMLEMATKNVETEDISQRDLRALSLAINEKNYAAITNEIKEFTRHLNQKYSQNESDKNCLIQWNSQFIKLTTIIHGEEK